jgi:hypothetical protein
MAAALGLFALAGGLWASSALARPVTPAEQRYWGYSGDLPACDSPGTLQDIAGRFHDRETGYWNSGLEIVGYDRVREIGNRTTGLDYVPRRYCIVRAVFNDGRAREVSYWIGENFGFAGYGYGVEWCVAGLDRHNADAPNCKMARP